MNQNNLIVDEQNNQVNIKFSKSFYDSKSLNEALTDYSSVCKHTLSESEGYFEVSLMFATAEDIVLIGNEFCNYVLGVMKNSNQV